MASILVKLVMDLWLEIPAQESQPLILSMLQAALQQPETAFRVRVFDLLYNLTLHGHVMSPMDGSDASDPLPDVRASPSLMCNLPR